MPTKTILKIFLTALISTAWLSSVAADETNETIYFLVAKPKVNDAVVQRDSYILPLSRPEDIDHARYLISLGRSIFEDDGVLHRTIVGARVGPGKDGINRNYFDPTFPEWSWHVVEFLEFSDVSADILNGSPTELEDDPAWYSGIDPRRGGIGFWAYTVVRELGPAPLFLSVVPDVNNVHFYWSGIGTGASWPLNTNHWTIPLTNAAGAFYRVRAEQAQQ